MTSASILTECLARQIRLAVDGDSLTYEGPRGAMDAALLGQIREHKPEILAELKTEKARAKVLADLRAHPGIRYAAEVDASGDPVKIMLAIRGIGTCVLEIDAQRWDLERFIALLDRQAGLGLGVAA